MIALNLYKSKTMVVGSLLCTILAHSNSCWVKIFSFDRVYMVTKVYHSQFDSKPSLNNRCYVIAEMMVDMQNLGP